MWPSKSKNVALSIVGQVDFYCEINAMYSSNLSHLHGWCLCWSSSLNEAGREEAYSGVCCSNNQNWSVPTSEPLTSFSLVRSSFFMMYFCTDEICKLPSLKQRKKSNLGCSVALFCSQFGCCCSFCLSQDTVQQLFLQGKKRAAEQPNNTC